MEPSRLPHNQQEEQTNLFPQPSSHSSRNDQQPQQTYVPTLTIVFILFTIAVIILGNLYIEGSNSKIQSNINQIIEKQDEKSSGAQVPSKESHDNQINEPKKDILAPTDPFGDQSRITIKNLLPHGIHNQNNERKEQTHISNQVPQDITTNPLLQTFQQSIIKAQTSTTNVPQLIAELLRNSSSKDLFCPKQIWIYVENSHQHNLLTNLSLQRTLQVANKSAFKVNLVNKISFKNLVDSTTYQKFNSTVTTLNKEAINNPVSGYDTILSSITRDLILLQLVHQFGGIALDKNLILTQNLTWLQTLSQNSYLNTGNPNFPTKYFGFHNVNFTSNEEKDGDRFIMKHVGLESFFFAGAAQGEFLRQVLKMMYIILVNPQSAKETLTTLKIGRAVTSLFVVSNSFPISCRIVLKEKQGLASKGLLAIDYFGIKSINSLFFPKKIEHHFQFSFDEKIYRNMAKYSLQEFQETVGPLRYMVLLPFSEFIDKKLKILFKSSAPVEGTQKESIHPDSFIVQYLIPNPDQSIIESDIEIASRDTAGSTWVELPKFIWVDRSSSPQGRNLIEEIIFRNIERQAKSSGFQVRTVDPQKLDQWLVKEQIQWIKNTAEKSKIKMFAKMKIQLAKLSLLIRHGGIWISRHFFTLESFEWVTKIASYPSQFIFNRYGDSPKVVMYFHPHYGGPFQWTFDSTANTKNIFNIGLDSSFIAAEPDSKLLKDWIRTFTKFLTRKYSENLSEMARLQVANERWTVKQNSYFALLDSIKIVMANKQKEINNRMIQQDNYTGLRSAAQYYQIWSISGTQGPLKLDLSFASQANQKGQIDSKSNSLIWRHPRNYTEGIIGKIHKMGRLYHKNSAQLQQILTSRTKQNLSQQIHPDSIFYHQLLYPVLEQLKQSNGYISDLS